jgi:hypothetical protein
MVKKVVIKPEKLDDDFLFQPMGQIGRYLMTNDILQVKEIVEEDIMEDIVGFLEMVKIRDLDKSVIGDTLKIFYTPKFTYKMVFMETDSKNKEYYNLIASIFHPEGKKIYYNAVIIKTDKDDNYCNVSKEEVIELLEKRQIHIGVKVHNDTVCEVTMDNAWNLVNENISLSGYIKKIIPYTGYFLLIITKGDSFELTGDENIKYIFAVVDKCKKVICDFYKEEYLKLLDTEYIEELDVDNPSFNLDKDTLMTKNELTVKNVQEVANEVH